uniref:DC1 domain-containing protein n=1 Tax=Oryza glaberrima TaxID=4538 RepID=I1NUK2_ORYGL
MTGHSKLRASEHHDHELTLTAGKESFRCDGCKEHGYHMRYVCKLGGCRGGFHLHEACAQHRFGDSYQDPFKRYSLVFHKSLPSTVQDDVRCDGCGGNIFRPQIKRFWLHRRKL